MSRQQQIHRKLLLTLILTAIISFAGAGHSTDSTSKVNHTSTHKMK